MVNSLKVEQKKLKQELKVTKEVLIRNLGIIYTRSKYWNPSDFKLASKELKKARAVTGNLTTR